MNSSTPYSNLANYCLYIISNFESLFFNIYILSFSKFCPPSLLNFYFSLSFFSQWQCLSSGHHLI